MTSEHKVGVFLDFPRNVVEIRILQRDGDEFTAAESAIGGALSYTSVPPNVEVRPLVKLPRIVAEKLRDELFSALGPPAGTPLFGRATTIIESPEHPDTARVEKIIDAFAHQIRQGGI